MPRARRRVRRTPPPTAAMPTAMRSRIAGTGSYLPAQVLTNDDLARRVDTSDEWILTRTGIRERHIAAPDGDDVSDLALHAARARARSGRHRARRRRSHHRRHDDAGHGVPVDGVHPAGQARRAPAAPAFDVQAVCSGFVYALARRRPDGRAAAWRATRWSSAPRSTRASSTGTIAAPACCSATAPAPSCWCRRATPGILSRAPARRRPPSPTSCACPGTRRRTARSPARRSCRWTASAVFKFAVSVLAEVARRGARRQTGIDGRATIDWLIPHQANIRIMRGDGEEARRAARSR